MKNKFNSFKKGIKSCLEKYCNFFILQYQAMSFLEDWRNRMPFFLIASVVVFVPLARCILFFDSYLVKLWFTQIVVAILASYTSYNVLFKNEKMQLNRKIDFFLFGYLVINIISWILVPAPHRYPAFLTLISFCFYVFLSIFVSRYLKEIRAQSVIVLLWVAVTVIICFYSFVQYCINKRVVGTLGNENFLGSHLGITIVVYIGYIFSHRLSGRKNILLRLFVLALFFASLYLTHSRGAWIGIITGLTFFAITAWVPRKKRILVYVFLSIVVLGSLFSPYVMEFMTKQFEGDVRPPIWEGTIGMITQKPLLGWGKGAYFIFYPQFRVPEYWLVRTPTDLTIHAHNEFLQILAETGIVGFLFFVIFIITILKIGINVFDSERRQQRFLLLGIISAIVCILTHNLVCNNLQMPSSSIFMWIMAGIVVSYAPKREFDISGNFTRIMCSVIFIALTFFIAIIILQSCIRPICSQYLFKRGTNYRVVEDWPNAIQNYNKAIRCYPWDIEMYYRLAYAFTMYGQYENAISTYKYITKLAPQYGSVHRNMAVVYMQNGDYKEAEASFIKALLINENDLAVHVNMAKLYSLKNEK
jgi:O-antigen ligase